MVEILRSKEESKLRGDVTRTISVPFVATGPPIVIASIGDEREIAFEGGTYQLTFDLIPHLQHRNITFEYGITIRFEKAEKPEFRIVLADDEMSPGEPLLLEAEPAA